MTQYSKRMVIIHWLTLALLLAAWYMGDSLADATDESRATLAGYIVHMSVGATVLLLTLARLFFRSQDGSPPAMVLFLLPLSGILTVVKSTAAKALLAGDAGLLPKEHGFHEVFAHEVHETLVTVLIVLVAIHLLGALKHQFIAKDGLLERMMLRRK
jgi:cytochrome b561